MNRKQKLNRKRRQSLSGPKFKKRKLEIVPPTKFLLGGNIKDPLNLNSLQDEAINKAMNALTPKCSPIPTPPNKKQKIEVIIPTNTRDPLNLISCGDDADPLTSSLPTEKKKSGSRRSRKRKKNQTIEGPKVPDSLNLNVTPNKCVQQDLLNKIVSPVVPQPGAWFKRPSNSVTRKKKSNQSKEPERPKFREEDKKFQYGNYNRYYGYRNNDIDEDPRLKILNHYKSMFKEKEVLDIGCNIGHITLIIARDFQVQNITGLDIDDNLIRIARKNVQHYISSASMSGPLKNAYPISMPILYGNINKFGIFNDNATFPDNVHFVQENYVTMEDTVDREYDLILCLSLTKWIHLNWGDDGLKRCFKRIFKQLRSGGKLILETQSWHSYKKKKKLTESIYNNFCRIRLHPKKFNQYLLSSEVGFNKSEILGWPQNVTRGFLRPLRMYTKS